MTQVSKFMLRPVVEKRIKDLLIEVIAGMRDRTQIDNFINDFMSPTERTVLFKRLAIAVLLAKGNDYQSISRMLRVTPVTISKMSFRIKYGNGSVKKVSEKILSKDAGKAIIQELASIFDVPMKGLPISEYHRKIKTRKKIIRRLKKEL